jgi:hypothetical protein
MDSTLQRARFRGIPASVPVPFRISVYEFVDGGEITAVVAPGGIVIVLSPAIRFTTLICPIAVETAMLGTDIDLLPVSKPITAPERLKNPGMLSV